MIASEMSGSGIPRASRASSFNVSGSCGVILVSLAMGLRADARAISEAYRMGRAGSSGDARSQAWLHRQQALALQFFASELARAPDRLRFLPNSPFGRLFVVTVHPHLAKDALALHFLLQY